MMKKSFFYLFLLFAQPMLAQQKLATAVPPRPLRRGVFERKIVDTASMRIYYAMNADDIKNPDTYLDLQMLQVGERMAKYSSLFVAQNDTAIVKWAREHPRADGHPDILWMKGKRRDWWTDYQYSEYFTEGNSLTEWAPMTVYNERDNSRYTEHYPLMIWQINLMTEEICGYKCQQATCRFRGRDFTAWFAPDIPIRKGPWKFGGLPGLILKVYDSQRFYNFECVGIEKGQFPITQYPEDRYRERGRKEVYLMQVRQNEDPLGYTGMMDLQGNPLSKKTHYEPLEKE